MDNIKTWLVTCLSYKKASHLLLDAIATLTAIHKAMGHRLWTVHYWTVRYGRLLHLVHRIQYCTAARTWFSYSSNTYITNNAGLVNYYWNDIKTAGYLLHCLSTSSQPHLCFSIHVGAEAGEVYAVGGFVLTSHQGNNQKLTKYWPEEGTNWGVINPDPSLPPWAWEWGYSPRWEKRMNLYVSYCQQMFNQ